MTKSKEVNQKADIINLLKTVYDPEIPVNIWDLGLVYAIDLQENGDVDIAMTLTSPNCPAIDILPQQVQTVVESIAEGDVHVDLVWEPAWDRSMLSEEVRLDLGMI
ncbi:MAG: iron-sulfur cluster assembly protein [Patescibacteria group bacterium]